MPKTAVGLFENPGLARGAISDIEALGFPRNEIRIEGEPLDFMVTGVMDIPRVDFEVGLTRELMRIGASKAEAEALVQGVKQGGGIVFATGPDEIKVDDAAQVMNRHGAREIEEVSGQEPNLSVGSRSENMTPGRERVQAGRVSYRGNGGGARAFVW